MNELTLYTDRCLTCSESDRMYKIKKFARDHGLDFRTKQTYMFPEYKQEAEEIGQQLPFLYLNGNTKQFFAVTSDLRVPAELNELIDDNEDKENEHSNQS